LRIESLTLLVVLCAQIVAFCSVTIASEKYYLDVWRELNGLHQLTINDIVQTRDGYIWLATKAGLCRFDGVRFTTFNSRNIGLLDEEIWDLDEDLEGGLWVATYGGGVTHYKKARSTTYTTKDGLPSDIVRSLAVDKKGSVWIGTLEGLTRFENGEFVTFTMRDGLSSNLIRKLFIDSRGTLWIGTTDAGLNCFKDGSFKVINSKLHRNITSIAETVDGSILVGTINPTGLFRIVNDSMIPVSFEVSKSNSIVVNQMLVNADGTILFATDDGLKEWRDGRVFSYEFSNTRIEAIQSLSRDHEGSLWLGTRQQGLARMKDQPFKSYTSADGLPDKLVGAIYEDNMGTIWIGQPAGLTKLTDGRLSRSKEDGSPNQVTSLAQSQRGTMWIGTSNGLYEYRDSSYRKLQGVGTPDVRALRTDSDGNLWVGTNSSGLLCVLDGKIKTYTIKDGLPGDSIRSIYQDNQRNLWIGTFGTGLSKFKDGQFTNFGRREGLVNDYVMTIYEEDDALWIGTRNGLNRLKNNSLTAYSTDNGLFADSILHIIGDGYGNLWMNSNRGLFRVRLKDLNEFADGKIKSLTSISYGVRDGISNNECTNTSLKAKDGKLYFGTFDGLVAVHPHELELNNAVPQVHIEEFFVDKHGVQIGNVLELSASTKEIEIRYAALSFIDPSSIRFKCMLEGYDNSWVEVGSRRVAYYTNLSPGQYRFRVIGSNNDGIWNEVGDSLSFYVKPYFYQTRWFYVGVALAIVLIIWLTHKWRLQLVAAQYKAIVNERSRIARELHDTLAQGLVGISNQLDGAMTLLKRDPNKATQQLEMSRKMARHYASEARRSVWALRSHALDEYGLPTALSILANQLAESHHNVIEVKVAGSYRKLPAHIEHNLLRIGQEAIVNAIKHAKASKIDLTVDYWPNGIRLIVMDDGCGFNAESINTEDNFGLLGMRERAAGIGAQLLIESQLGKGTVVTVELK
jgi:signal transduction histidine kinase/ligand-binding sensor domain-containing protein